MYKYRRIIIGAIAAILVVAMLAGIIVLSISAETSGEIKKKIEGLEEQEKAIESQKEEIDSQLNSKSAELNDLVQKKNLIDQQIKLTMDAIDNKTQQIQEYNLLIAEKQKELDDALAERDRLNEKYKARIRSMEENGKITYWSILFKASSFSDMLDRVDLINEIASADARMLDKIEKTAQQIEAARQDLAAEKVSLEEAKEQLSLDEANLEQQRAEADEVFMELWTDKEALKAAAEKYEAQMDAIADQIAKKEAAYKEAVAAEEAAKRKAAEEAAKRKAEEEARAAAAKEKESTGSTKPSAPSSAGFIWPSYCHTITCYYGPRIHPVTGKPSFHNGIDLGAQYGTPIVAAKSGTVTFAGMNGGYGYSVTINHGDGFSTLYGHMSRYIVSSGDYVTQGQTIGYIGSTGWSTGPHLHFTIFYGGSSVNPLRYLP